MKIDGKQITRQILSELKTAISNKKAIPHLAIIIVGDDPASKSYVKQKILKGKEVGIKTTLIKLDSNITQQELVNVIKSFNEKDNIDGIIVQKPLPVHIDNEAINLAINPDKDIDGFNPNSKFDPPIGLAALEILKTIYKSLDDLKNKNIVILGKGETGGGPIKKALLKIGSDPIVIDSKTENSASIISKADIVISAVGKKEIVRPEMLKKDVILIGAGQHLGNDKKMHGDYNEEQIKNISSFYTSTPGGIGPVNVAMLLKNLLDSQQ